MPTEQISTFFAQEGIDRVDSLVALTGIDEENMIISMYSQSRFVDKIVTKVNRLSFAELMESHRRVQYRYA